MQSITNVKQCW